MNTMEYNWEYIKNANRVEIYFITVTLILIFLLSKTLFYYCKELIKHFSRKNLQENEFIITFASEIERDRILALMEQDKQETEDLEKQAKTLGLKVIY